MRVPCFKLMSFLQDSRTRRRREAGLACLTRIFRGGDLKAAAVSIAAERARVVVQARRQSAGLADQADARGEAPSNQQQPAVPLLPGPAAPQQRPPSVRSGIRTGATPLATILESSGNSLTMTGAGAPLIQSLGEASRLRSGAVDVRRGAGDAEEYARLTEVSPPPPGRLPAPPAAAGPLTVPPQPPAADPRAVPAIAAAVGVGAAAPRTREASGAPPSLQAPADSGSGVLWGGRTAIIEPPPQGRPAGRAAAEPYREAKEVERKVAEEERVQNRPARVVPEAGGAVQLHIRGGEADADRVALERKMAKKVSDLEVRAALRFSDACCAPHASSAFLCRSHETEPDLQAALAATPKPLPRFLSPPPLPPPQQYPLALLKQRQRARGAPRLPRRSGPRRLARPLSRRTPLRVTPPERCCAGGAGPRRALIPPQRTETRTTAGRCLAGIPKAEGRLSCPPLLPPPEQSRRLRDEPTRTMLSGGWRERSR
jgi:hypothetical protein